MKKKALLLTASLGILTITLMSYERGAGVNGVDCTGAETGSMGAVGCSQTGSGCHATAATTGLTVKVELDSAGVAVKKYVPGMSYTVKITGTNTTGISLPKFGFQVAAIKGNAAGATPLNAGTFASTGLPTGVQYSPASATSLQCNLVEQSAAIAATTGTGGAGTTYVESFGWTAPATGTGTVTLWGVLNAVNADGSNDTGDHWNTAIDTISERTLGVEVLTAANSQLLAYPNPFNGNLNVTFSAALNGEYSVSVFDLNGRTVANQKVNFNGSNICSFNSANWQSGLYIVRVSGNGFQQTARVIKQ